MRDTEYHIQEIQADLSPTFGEVKFAGAHLELEMGEGIYNDEEDSLQTEATLELNLYSEEDHEGAEDDDLGEPSHGSIKLEIGIFVEEISANIENMNIQEEVGKWNSEGYEHIHPRIIGIIESGFVSEIIAPIDQLLDDSFVGILPIYVFTERPGEEEELEEVEPEAETETEERGT